MYLFALFACFCVFLHRISHKREADRGIRGGLPPCCRAGRRAGTAAYAGLQLGHLVHDLVALAQIVAVDVDCAGFADGKSEIYHLLC
mgnify:CR=1 FL=1